MQFDASPMLFQDSAYDRETKPRALLACRDIRLQQSVAVLLRQPNAVVDHVDDDVVSLAPGDDTDATLAAVRMGACSDGLRRIFDDVRERLRNQSAIEARRHRVLCK